MNFKIKSHQLFLFLTVLLISSKIFGSSGVKRYDSISQVLNNPNLFFLICPKIEDALKYRGASKNSKRQIQDLFNLREYRDFFPEFHWIEDTENNFTPKKLSVHIRISSIFASDLSTEDKVRRGIEGLAELPSKNYALLWERTSQNAAENNSKPKYLEYISAMLNKKIADFSSRKEKDLGLHPSKSQLSSHAYALLYSIGRAGYDVASDSIPKALLDADQDACFPEPYETTEGDVEDSATEAIDTALTSDFIQASTNLFNFCGYYRIQKAFEATYDDSYNTFDEARELVGQALLELFDSEYYYNSETDYKKFGRLAYLIAEKVHLLFLINHADILFEQAYCKAIVLLPSDPKGLFDSYESLQTQKSIFLSETLANPNQAHFIRELINQLDRIARLIEHM